MNTLPTPDDLGIRVVDPIGAHAVKCMRRISALLNLYPRNHKDPNAINGIDVFLDEEMANPTRDDEDWRTTVVQWVAQRASNRAAGRPVTWRPPW